MKIKVLVYGFTYNIGGIETFYMNYYRKLDKDKYQVDFIKVYDKIAFEDELVANGSKMIVMPKFNKNPIKFAKEFRKILKKEKYNVVHANMLTASNIAHLREAKKMGVPVIIAHSHNGNGDQSKLNIFMHKYNKHKIKKYANCLLACSEVAATWMFDKKSKYKVLNNAIDINKLSFNKQDRDEVRHELNCEGKFVIGHVGRFNNQKNHMYLIDIFNNYAKINDNAVLLLVGEGNLENEVRQKVESLGISDKVMFLGKRMDTHRIYNAMDCFVIPSFFEGLPVVGIEAQTNGLPCIFSSNITTDLKLNDNISFISIEENDIQKWGEQLDLIYNNNERCNDISNVRAKYDIDEQVKELEEIYDGAWQKNGNKKNTDLSAL